METFKKKFLFVIIIFLFNYGTAKAIEDDLHITIIPEYPRAKQTVKIQAESYLTDLNRADIFWYKNDKLEQGGQGQKTFSFQTTNVGSSDEITLQIKTSSGEKIFKSIIIAPTEVNLIWESDTYTPYYYKGKALNSFQSNIKIVAMPNFIKAGKKIKSENLIYKWKKDWKVLGNDSGYGKNILYLNGNKNLRDYNISVEVTNSDNTLYAFESIPITYTEPEVIFYENSPLFGILNNKTLNNGFDLDKDEINLVAEPFFFSNQNNLDFEWFLNNKKIEKETTKNITLRQNSESSGLAKLNLKIKNPQKIMQFKENYFNIKLNGTATQSDFTNNNE